MYNQSPRRGYTSVNASPIRQPKTAFMQQSQSLMPEIGRISPSRLRKSMRGLSRNRTPSGNGGDALSEVQTYTMARSFALGYATDSGSSASLAPYPQQQIQPAPHSAFGSSKTRSLNMLMDRSGKRGSLDQYNSQLDELRNVQYDRDQSLDRHLERRRDFHTFGSPWDRAGTIGQEYPTMGAKSLERDHLPYMGASRLKSREWGGSEYVNEEPQQYFGESKNGFVLDLQSQVAELNKECAILQQELDSAREKLTSTMTSIKTFWSPELKKERALRKEDTNQLISLSEQLKMAEIENRQHLNTIVRLEQDLRTLRTNDSSHPMSATGQLETDITRREKERHMREMKLLRQTVEEMELRISTQQQTMQTRDDTIRRLMDLVQTKNKLLDYETSDIASMDSSSKSEGSSNNILELNKMKNENIALMRELERLRSERIDFKTDNEVKSWQEKVVTMEKHFLDHDRNLCVLRDQISSKDQQMQLLQADIECMRDRLKEKEEQLDKKSRQFLSSQNEKQKLSEEISTCKDEHDTAVRKCNALQRKIESLEESICEKDLALNASRSRLTSLQADQSNSGTALSSLEELLNEKEKQIERLSNQKDKLHVEFEEEVKIIEGRSSEFKVKIEELQKQLIEAQNSEADLRLEITRIKSEKQNKETQIARLELNISQLNENISDLQLQLKRLSELSEKNTSTVTDDFDRKLAAIQSMLEESKMATKKAVDDFERIQKNLTEKEAFILELNRQIEGYRDQILRISSQDGSNKNKEDAIVFKSIIQDKDARVKELEEALRESIRISAQREVILSEQQMKTEHTERMMESMQEELLTLKKTIEDHKEQLSRCRMSLTEKDDQLRRLVEDSKKQLAEVYEMKQEAILAAISEKDAHIALLEMAPNKKTENIEEVDRLSKEKIKLQQVLKELTQSRMKLINTRGHTRSSSASSLLHYVTHRDQLMQKIDFGTYYVYHNELLDEEDLL